MQVIDIIEKDDGSATLQVELEEDEVRDLLEFALRELLDRYVKGHVGEQQGD